MIQVSQNVIAQKDWFEFLLDLNLLDKHLTHDNAEPNGCALIVQFLYHANLIEQQYGHSKIDNQPLELKQKRINVLRILAIKAAALLEWNLSLFEKEIPIAVMSDLLQILLKLTLKSDKPHLELNLSELEGCSLFCLQLLHRWCLRTVMSSKFIHRPQKIAQITAPGIVNPLQHMREANENILKVLLQNVQDSIDFLEKFLSLDKDLQVPTSKCFSNISSDTGEYELIWSNGAICSPIECKTYIKYDLAKYFFQQENYSKCFKLLQSHDHYFKTLKSEYFYDFDALLSVSREICANTFELNNENADVLPMIESQPHVSFINKIEISERNGFNGILNLLLEDNRKHYLSITDRLELEKKSQVIPEAFDQISSCNLVRLIQDDYAIVDYELSKLNYLSIAIIESPLKHHTRLLAFVRINFEKLTKNCQKELIRRFDLNSFKVLDESNIEMESSPSSPTDNSTNTTQTNAVYDCFKQAVNTNDPIVLKNLILKYNQLTNNKGLRNYWQESWSSASVLSHLSQQYQNNVQNNLNKFTSTNTIDFFHICLAKVNALVASKNYESALKLLKSLEDVIKESNYLVRFTSNLILLTTIKRHLDEFDLKNEIKVTKNQEQVLGNCKAFIGAPKNESDSSAEMIRSVFAYLLAFDELKGILNLNESKKPSAATYTGYLELCKKLIRFYLDSKSDKTQVKKLSRDLWDCVIEIFTDSIQTKRYAGDSNLIQTDGTSQITRESPNACLTRESFSRFVKILKNPQLLSIILSLLSTLYNINDSAASNEIHSDYRLCWPLSVSSSANVNLNCLMDTLGSLVKHCLSFDPYNSSWLRTISDLCLSQSHYSDAIKYSLQVIANETNFFFSNSSMSKVLNEKLLKSMIKSLLQLNKHTQVALLCQYLPVIDYTTAFKCIQENVSLDESDLFYECIWDVTLLEYVAYTHSQRGYYAKRDLALRLLSEENINSSNPSDIHQNMIDFKRNNLFLLLINHFLIQ